MSEYGLKIKNFQAGSVYAYSLGVRDKYHFTDAMLTNSLFSDFIKENGLVTFGKKNDTTKDIICIEFDYGTRSYEEEISHINSLMSDLKKNNKILSKEKNQKIEKLNKLKQDVELNKDKFDKKSADEIRTLFYTNGVSIEYVRYNKKNKIEDKEIIHYKMLYRTPGKAKKGSCMFINEELYDVAISFLRMGIELPYNNSPIVEMGAYSSLVTSSIVGKIKINPKNILIIKDIDSFFETNVVSVETDKNKHCIAKKFDKYKLKNTLYDGQALIDSSIFPDYGNGYVLLRHHLCKMAAFCSNIQLFFKDYYGVNYYSSTVKDMWGNDHYVKDIELITTDNAMKWLKFNISYEYWCNKVYDNDCMFGVVKTAHESKLGNVQRMSYQMGNSLELDIMPQVTECTMNYITKLKTNDDAFLDYLRDNYNFSNDYEVLVALCEQDRDFLRSEYFRSRKRDIIKTYITNFKNGKIIQNADNLVIVGSPYAMLLSSVGEDISKDDTFEVENGTIQCYTERFDNGEYLAEFRSPFNSKNNMGYLHNVYNNKFSRYFKFGKQIIAINMIGTDFQDRNNGSDQDSDGIYTTNQPEIVACAKEYYLKYPTIVNNIPKEKNTYDNTLENYAKIDNNLAAAQLAIGESSNLAQVCLTYTYNFEDQKYVDYVCILSVLAQVAIDNAKRRFDIDLTEEISNIKSNMNIDKNRYPNFWTVIRRGFDDVYNKAQKRIQEINLMDLEKLDDEQREELMLERLKLSKKKSKINKELVCPMNYIFDIKSEKYRSPSSTLPMSTFFVKYELDEHKRKSKKVEELIQKYSLNLYETCQKNYDSYDEDNAREQYLLLCVYFDELIEDIKQVYISKNYLGLMSWLINRAFYIGAGTKRNVNSMLNNTDKNKSILLKVLYNINKDAFLKCFSNNITKNMDS